MVERNRNIDIVKGIAIFCVLWGHCIQGMVSDDAFFNLWVVKLIYSFHMPLFALTSGYLFFRTSQKSVNQIFISRLISIGIPFVVWNLLLCVRRCFFEALIAQSFQFGIIKMLHSFGSGLWFLKSLFIIIAITTFIVKYVRRQFKYLCCFGVWIFLIIFNTIVGDHTANLFPFFLLGYGIAVSTTAQQSHRTGLCRARQRTELSQKTE